MQVAFWRELVVLFRQFIKSINQKLYLNSSLFFLSKLVNFKKNDLCSKLWLVDILFRNWWLATVNTSEYKYFFKLKGVSEIRMMSRRLVVIQQV